MSENIETIFSTDSGVLRINKLQICWGKAKVELNPTPGHRNLHTRKFSATFGKDARGNDIKFAKTPIVTHAVHNNSKGHALVVYKWSPTTTGFSGFLNNMYVSKSFDGVVEVEFIAIGEAGD